MRHKVIKHKKVKVSDWGWINTDDCPCGDMFAHYLWMAAPEIKWLYVEDVGSYQGDVYAIGKYKRQWFIMHDYYGSCSWCGAWGEGGEPEKLKDVLENGELFKSKKDALNFVIKTYAKKYESPTEKFYEVLTTQAKGVSSTDSKESRT